MTATEILTRLESLGFTITDKKGLGENFRTIYKNIHKGYPEWRNSKIKDMLDF